jgi:hypothetical protein
MRVNGQLHAPARLSQKEKHSQSIGRILNGPLFLSGGKKYVNKSGS